MQSRPDDLTKAPSPLRFAGALHKGKRDRQECLSYKHGIAPPALALWGDVARTGKLQQLFLETVLKTPTNCRESLCWILRSLTVPSEIRNAREQPSMYPVYVLAV